MVKKILSVFNRTLLAVGISLTTVSLFNADGGIDKQAIATGIGILITNTFGYAVQKGVGKDF